MVEEVEVEVVVVVVVCVCTSHCCGDCTGLVVVVMV